eukprot:SAG31_NODE_1445_length_8320_cov_3.454081_2_plen_41_part_00
MRLSGLCVCVCVCVLTNQIAGADFSGKKIIFQLIPRGIYQ